MEKHLVSPNPHIHAKASTSSIMGDVLIALLPASIVAILLYGWSELVVLLLSMAFCVFIEWAITKYMFKKSGWFCGASAMVTGLLLGLNLPSSTPWWIILVGAIVAIGIAKMSFGGLGQNIFNPAITARVFLLVSFPVQMTNWAPTKGFVHVVDAISGATPLSVIKEALKSGQTLPELFGPHGFSTLLAWDLGASAGEVSALALLAGFVYLLVRKVVKPWIPLSIFITVAVIASIFHGIDPSHFTDAHFNLLTGGVILGACFMATDYVTAPMSNWGGVIYGVGIGLILMMIRYFGSYPEGMSFAILIMNCFVPLINRAFHQKKYGRA